MNEKESKVMIDMAANFGYKAPVKSADLVAQLVRDSEMIINLRFGDYDKSPTLSRLTIQIHGALAHIPSIKNNRHPRFPGIDKKVLAKLKALDILFFKAVEGIGYSKEFLNLHDSYIFITLITANSKRAANEDNAMTTIKDWLEPRTKIVGGKNKKDRGWGIGIIKDDIQARGIALKSEDLNRQSEHTLIVIQKWVDVSHKVSDFVSNFV